MADWITPDTMWQDRVRELEEDFKRIEILLDSNLDGRTQGLGGSFRQTLSEIQARVQDLKQGKVGGEPGERWKALADASQKCQATAAFELELLAGVALRSRKSRGGEKFDSGFVNRSEIWLHQLHKRVNVRTMPVVIPGRGALLRLESVLGRDIVRVPFPDWDLWHLPLLEQATGLLAVDEDVKKKFAPVIDHLLPQVAAILQGEPRAPLCDRLDLQRVYLRYLCADMFATAILGPVYALALFVLELEYGDPALYGCEDPDKAGEATANRILPAPVERAAAILATLEYMNQAQGSPYKIILGKLEGLYQTILASVEHSDLLETTRQRFRPWHTMIFEQAIRNLVGVYFPKIKDIWERAQAWCNYLSKNNTPAPAIPPGHRDGDWFTLEMASAIWLHRIHYPARADDVHRMAERILAGGGDITPYSGIPATSLPRVVAEARLHRAERRWLGFQSLLQDENWVRAEDQVAVAGRFYQMLSREMYSVDERRAALKEESVPAEEWAELTELEDVARPVQREAFEFMGGLQVIYRDLDREPAQLINNENEEKGPSVSALADRLLLDHARRSGVNWSARTILGRDPFLALDTDVIRIRFPDWSLWNLPLMGHEFGHVVARATREFQRYRRGQVRELAQKLANTPDAADVEVVEDHLEEFFADVFATYTLGPAFACAAITLRFSPFEAYWERVSYPTHHERVQVILGALGQMSAQTRRHEYDAIRNQLERGWDATVRACGAEPTDPQRSEWAKYRLERAKRWGHDLYKIIDQLFRLGDRYTPEQWTCAGKLAERLAKVPIPTLVELAEIGQKCKVEFLSLDDLLNALWWARIALGSRLQEVTRLTLAAYRIGHDILGE